MPNAPNAVYKNNTQHTNTRSNAQLHPTMRETHIHSLTDERLLYNSLTHIRMAVSVCLYGPIVAYSRRIIVSLVMNLMCTAHTVQSQKSQPY